MNEISIIDTGLVIPHTPKECKEFLIKAKPVLQAIKAQIKLIEDVEDLENLRDDLKEKGRYISEMILDAEVKIGEYTLSLPKATKGNQYTGKMVSNISVTNQNNKKIDEMVVDTTVYNQNNNDKEEKTSNTDVTSFEGNHWQKGSTAPLPKAVNQYKSARCSAALSKNASYSSADNQNRQSNIGVTLAKNVECSPEKTSDSSVDSYGNNYSQQCEEFRYNCQSDSSVNLPKKEVIQKLGFNQKQVERFEILAKNKDLVEQVKQEARENNTNPTRTQVLSLAQARKQMQEQKEEEYKEFCENSEKSKKIFNQLIDSLGFIKRLNNEDIELAMMTLDNNLSKDIIAYIQEAQIKLALLKQEAEKYKGVKIWQEKEY